MATISSPGLGSGLDVNSIVSQLVAIERRPIDLLQAQKESLKAKLSSFGLLQSYTVNVRDAVSRLTSASLWEQTKASSSDSSAVSVSSTAAATKGSYNIAVSQLAQAHGLASGAYDSSTSLVGSGTLTIEFGDWNLDANDDPTTFELKSAPEELEFDIEATDTLADVRDRINAANGGVTASIVNDATGSRLVLRSGTTGAENAMRVTVDDPSLTQLAFDPENASGTMDQTVPAKNAQVTIDGLPVSSSSNTLSGVVSGLTLKLAKTTSSTQVSVGLDTGSMRSAVDDFVKSYNEVARYIAEQTKYDPDTKTSGKLQGDTATRSLQGQLRAALGAASGASSSFSRLSDLGIQLQRDGTLKVDDSKFSDALTNPQAVQAAFTADADGQANDGFAVRIKALAVQLTASDGLVSTRTQGLRASIDRSDKQIARYEDRIAQTQARLLQRYSALDSTLNQITGLGGFVSQQITNWNKKST